MTEELIKEKHKNTEESENLLAISEINAGLVDASDSSLLQNEDRLEVRVVPTTSSTNPSLLIKAKRRSCCNPCCCCCGWKACLLTTLLLLYVLAFTYLFLLPFAFYLLPSLQREMVFFNDLLRNVTDPAERGLNCTTQLRLPSDGGRVELGTWIVPPPSAGCDRTLTPAQLLSTSSLVVLYAHGSGSSRANRFRAEAYKVLTGHLNATVVTFDYRGFGDSTPEEELPSVGGTVNDTAAIFEWILKSGAPPRRILLWGHSLGTSIVVQVLSRLAPSQVPLGAVLEAPFTSFEEELPEHPMNSIYRHLPYFRPFILDPVVGNPDLNFDSLTPLPSVRCPLLILHSEDDPIVPFHLGVRLYEVARAVQPNGVGNRTAFHRFPAGHGYRHNKIRLAPELPKVVGDFIRAISV